MCLCLSICMLFGLELREDTAFKKTREQFRRLKKKSRGRGVLFPQTPLKVDEKPGRAVGLPFRGLSHSSAWLPTLAEGLSLSPFCRWPS